MRGAGKGLQSLLKLISVWELFKYQAQTRFTEAGEWLEANRDRWPYWLPVLLAFGIGLYFSLPTEPELWLVLLLMAAASAGVWLGWRRGALHYAMVAAAVIILGVAAGTLRSHLVAAPLLVREIGPVEVTGTLISREAQVEGSRILLNALEIEKVAEPPRLLRITLPRTAIADLPAVGTRVRVLVNLMPPADPVTPGAYNFRRQAFFQQIGGYGYALRPPELVSVADGEDSGLWAERLREAMSRTIGESISGPEGAIAVALMTGERGAIDDKTNDDMRAAGTAHLLSISGMHIGMVGGIIFFMVRLLLVLVPGLALRWPIKKIAAGAGLVVVVAYTFLVGAPVAAERAMLMAGLVFIAIMLDRLSLSLRPVALAAAILLLVMPESLLHPSFQLSFAAIVFLVAGYEWWATRQGAQQQPTLWLRGGRYVGALVVTSLIAGLATAPFAAYHFHRVQLLGVIGNLIAVPITGVVVMPMAVLSYALMPFGLADPALRLMGWGLEGVTQSAAWVAALPGANINLPNMPLAALVMMTLGGLWLAIWRGWPRLLGLVPVLLGFVWTATAPLPVALVSDDGRVMAVRAEDGQLRYSRAGKGLLFNAWGQTFDDGRAAKSWRLPAPGLACDALGCVMGGIAVQKQPEATFDDCEKADLIIAPEVWRLSCAKNVMAITKADLKKRGAHAVYADGDSYRIEASKNGWGKRPWDKP